MLGQQPGRKFTQPINCATGIIWLHIGFPNCWDGVNLDSTDHQSHMAYPIDDGKGGYSALPTTRFPSPG